MRRIPITFAAVACALAFGCSESPTQPEIEPAFAASSQACWGQATKVFAKTGELGLHSRNQSNPRYGLARLARELYDAGIIDAPTMQALGKFVADDLGLSIDACL